MSTVAWLSAAKSSAHHAAQEEAHAVPALALGRGDGIQRRVQRPRGQGRQQRLHRTQSRERSRQHPQQRLDHARQPQPLVQAQRPQPPAQARRRDEDVPEGEPPPPGVPQTLAEGGSRGQDALADGHEGGADGVAHPAVQAMIQVFVDGARDGACPPRPP